MRFVLKALFFLAVVAAFIPRQPDAEAAPTPELPSELLSEPAEAAAIDLQAEAADAAGAFCERKPALCGTVQESAAAARLIGSVAMQQARQAIADATAEVPAPADTAPAS